MVVFGGTVFKCTASGVARDASGAVIVVVALAFQFGIGNRAVFDGRAIAHACNAAHKTVIIYSGCHEIGVFDMQILNRTKENPSKYSCGCEAVSVYLSGGLRVCDDVPVTVVIACKASLFGIADRFPFNACQVDVGGLLKIIAIAVIIVRRRVAGIQKFRQIDQIFARGNQLRVSLCAGSAAKHRPGKRSHRNERRREAQRQKKNQNLPFHFHSSQVFFRPLTASTGGGRIKGTP